MFKYFSKHTNALQPNKCNMASFLVIKLFFVIVFFKILSSSVLGLDSCRDYTSINNPYRSAKYKFDFKSAALCDDKLVSGWYRFTSIVGGTIPTTKPEPNMCGTVAPIWMKGTLPTKLGIIENTTACVNYENRLSGCYSEIPLSVIKCTGDYYVYYLRPPRSCSLAYCAGDKEPCPENPSAIVPNCKEPTTIITQLQNVTTAELQTTAPVTGPSTVTTAELNTTTPVTEPTIGSEEDKTTTTKELAVTTEAADGKSEPSKDGIFLSVYAYVGILAGFVVIIGLIVWFFWRKLHKKTQRTKKEVGEKGCENPVFNDNISPKLDSEQEPVYESLDLQNELKAKAPQDYEDLDSENGYQQLDKYHDLGYVTMVADDPDIKDKKPKLPGKNTLDYEKLDISQVPTYERLIPKEIGAESEPKDYYNSTVNPDNKNSLELQKRREPAYVEMVPDEVEMKATEPKAVHENAHVKLGNNQREQAYDKMIPPKINPREPELYYNLCANPQNSDHDLGATQEPAYEKMAPPDVNTKTHEFFKTNHNDLGLTEEDEPEYLVPKEK
ncbi:uncharacterized protein LOC116614035 isoform X2 [Nematostella vectensis]|uniref:uncharacterized protein LOC116614035 isoform X2 n=1 Tax=Nematostella vectensis TaxID=45351 RepID=UPI00207736D7|nr:uncharacterized protein LOC116614035 isoform X2 [Nematostella vectensis]